MNRPSDLDRPLCLCFHVSRRKVVNFVRNERPRYASQITECFSAGTGCGWCIPFLEEIHRRITSGADLGGWVSPEDYEAGRDRYRDDVRTGRRERHRLRGGGRAIEAPPDDDGSLRRSVSPEPDASWDATSYFSRPTPTEPEPDDLAEG